MTSELSDIAARVREFIRLPVVSPCGFDALALELFTLQFVHNSAYQKICTARGITPLTVTHWSQIPAVPTTAFKEFDLTCLAADERSHVFHSSGTTEQRPSRHFHCAESLAVYETSLLVWFREHFAQPAGLLILTPAPAQAPHSSLGHMFESVRRDCGAAGSVFIGKTDSAGGWTLDFERVVVAVKQSAATASPLLLLGTAFSFVHLLDHLAEKNLRVVLPRGSRVMETGGYKGRSRCLPKAELHALITERLTVPASQIICEYGMSELSSQAYDLKPDAIRNTQYVSRSFHFPPWTRVQIISPETGREVADGEAGLIRVFDLANVFSVAAIQTEDLAIRRGDGFELMGRATQAEPRGCSLMAV